MRYLSDGLHWTLPAMVLGFGGLLLLVPLGWVLTFGLFGLPELGAGGLGIASAIMLWAQVLAFTAYLARSKRFAALELFVHFDRPHWATIRGLLATRSDEHTSELQSLMLISYAVFCFKK